MNDGRVVNSEETNVPQACDLLIRNAYVFTMDTSRTVIPNGAVAISGKKIVSVGPDREVAAKFRPARTIDAEGAPVHPGMVDCHVHVTLHACRGAFSDMPGLEEGQSYFYQWMEVIESEQEYASSLLACLEMVRNGVTCFMEPGTAFDPDSVASAASDVGIRASVTDPLIWDIQQFDYYAHLQRLLPGPDAIHRLGGQLSRNKDSDSLIRGHVGLVGSATATDELMLAAKACADKNHAILNQHQSFGPPDVDADDARYGKHSMVHFAELGLLGPNVSFVHMNIIRDDEIDPIVNSGISLVWCAANCMYWGIHGGNPTRMPRLYRQGANVAFGTDLAKVWSFNEQGFVAYLAARETGDYLSPEQVLEMSTICGAQATGFEQLTGSIEVGKHADLVIRSNSLPEAQPDSNVVRNLVLVSRSKSVHTVIVDGRVVLEGGHSTLIDEAETYQKAREAARTMLRRLGVTPTMEWAMEG